MTIVRRTRTGIDLLKVDWTALAATNDEEIAQQAASDPDTAPIFTTNELKQARRVLPPTLAEDVRAIRRHLGLSQQQFAIRFGFTVETIRNYEQGHRRPTGPARVLLRIIATNPDAVVRALAS